jgi:phosphoenolpyruvate-protein kinase (PTS system EI component)
MQSGELKKKKAEFRTLSHSVNRVKREIDELSAKLAEKRAGKAGGDGMSGAIFDIHVSMYNDVLSIYT